MANRFLGSVIISLWTIPAGEVPKFEAQHGKIRLCRLRIVSSSGKFTSNHLEWQVRIY